MTDREGPIPAGHTPQHNVSMEPRPDPTPDQDQGDSTEFLEQLAGTHADATAYIDDEDIEQLQDITMTDVYQGETDVNQERSEASESLGMLESLELREGETDDVMVAVEEGLTYVPPIDPPIQIDQDDPESIQVAAGFGLTADEPEIEGSFESARTTEDDMVARVRRALLNDSMTSHLADRLQIVTVHGTVTLRGMVDDLDDTDNIVAVVSDIPGVEAVRDETTVRGL